MTAAERAEYMLRTVAAFIDDNPVGDYEIFYDEALCDGHCLADDCISAADDLGRTA
jgi:hypothetical protein